MKNMKRRTEKRKAGDELRREYDLSRLKGGVRGKYVERYRAGTNLVLLSPDVAEYFPDEQYGITRLNSRGQRPDTSRTVIASRSLPNPRESSWSFGVSRLCPLLAVCVASRLATAPCQHLGLASGDQWPAARAA